MISLTNTSVIFLSALLLVLSLGKRSLGSPLPGLVAYWGQSSDDDEFTLDQMCWMYSTVNIGFLDKFGGGQEPELNLGKHCTQDCCTKLSRQITRCQRMGVKVFISLGSDGNYTLTSKEDAKKVADYIWMAFLGGNDYGLTFRPLGNAVLDGVDLYIKKSPKNDPTRDFWHELTASLKEHDDPEGKRVYVSASPQCPYPDPYLDRAINNGSVDYVWPRFFNNPSCQYGDDGDQSKLLATYTLWTRSVPSTVQAVAVGIPASRDQAPEGGYMESSIVRDDICTTVYTNALYGGIMLYSFNGLELYPFAKTLEVSGECIAKRQGIVSSSM
ncbi:hypothetical protein Tsubulata_022887 [Turnera subulata]|uniref:chitinase n=1 Tax=Turnera subulata TaxID=218843 RepID=A0A9Q0J9V2_9ROSI|nr:hypothetical protein Tsubulata_022887 [Turnera subulata]